MDTSISKTSWTRLLVLFTLASLVETMIYSQLTAFTPLFLPELGVPKENIPFLVGLIATISNGLGIPFLPFWGALADRFSRKPIILRSFIVILFSVVLAIIANNIWFFLAARSLTGLALGNSGLMMTTLSERLPKNRIGLGFSIMNSAVPIGAFIGPLIGGWVMDAYGFRTMLLLSAVILSAIILAIWLGFKDTFQSSQQDPILRMAWDSVLLIGRSRRLRALFPALFLLFGGWMMAFTYVPLAITEIYTGDDPAIVVGVVIGASGLTTLILAPILGALSDKFGSWRILFIGSACTLLLWPVPSLTRNLIPFAIAWSILNGMVSAVFAISFSVLSASIEDKVRGRVMSFAYMPVNIGFMVGAFIGTQITASSIFNVFPAAAVFTALGMIALVIAYRQKVTV